MEIRLLGPVELYSARGPVPIGSAKQRALLAFLALHPQRLLTYDVLIDGLWGHDPPDATVQALRFHVSRLRGILRQADDADRLRTRPGGYQLVIAEDAVDVLRFERAIAGARLARSEGAAADTVSRAFRDALDLWVGPALADVNGEPFVVGERRRLEELRLAATEDYLAAELAAARHADAVGELERMVDRHPLRERLWELLITALYRSGRQADALAAYQRVRRILADELGIEPSAPLRQLEHQVLLQDAGLAAPSTSPRPGSDPSDEPLTAAADAEPPPAEADARAPRGRATNRRATVAIITGVVAFSASVGLLLYRHVTSDSETADRTEVSNDSETADRTEVSNQPPAEGRETPISMLQVGDCLNVLPRPDPTVQSGGVTQVPETVLLVPCEGPHEQEVYHLFELAAGPYPGDEQVQGLALEQCSSQFQNYVGVPPDESELDFFYVFPMQYTWELGNRRGGCSLLHPAGLDLTGSMAGSRR
jgi:DNA-binding SARP family transcriptional activator